MRVVELLNEMTEKDARYVFLRFGVDPDQVPDLKAARNRLMMKYHPDRGGNLQFVQAINSAYDVLTQKPRAGAPSTEPMAPEPTGSNMPDYSDGRWYGSNYGGNHDWGLEQEAEPAPVQKPNSRYDRYRRQQ